MTDPRFIEPSERDAQYRASVNKCYDGYFDEGLDPWIDHALAADRRIAELEAKNENWKDHYNDLIGKIPNYLLTDINDGTRLHVCEYRSAYEEQYEEQLAEARSLIDELAEQLIEHSSTNGSAKIPSHHKANAVLAKVEAYKNQTQTNTKEQ